MENLRLNALALHLGVEVDELSVCSYNDNVIGYGNQEYLVVTDDEANELWDEDLENYIDECLEIPESIKPYFDREGWKSDARHDGRARSLSHYDGNEDEITVFYSDFKGETYYNEVDTIEIDGAEEILNKSETFYIYRQN